MFYSIFLIFFALQKYYLMICSYTFTHMATERNVWTNGRTCTHLRLHHDPYVSRSQRKEKQVQITAQSSHRSRPSQMVCTSGSRSPLVRTKKLPRQYLQRATYGSSHVMRNEMKAGREETHSSCS